MIIKDCLVCERINQIKSGKNNLYVVEMNTGYVVLGDFQYYLGYTLFLSKHHVAELHQLDEEERINFLAEMSVVAEAVYRVFKPNKLNYELLGNTYSHMHWHIFPRYNDDPNVNRPIWEVGDKIRTDEKYRITDEQLLEFKSALNAEIKSILSKK